METQELKSRLIKKIETANENELRQLESLFDSFNSGEKDWYDELPPIVKQLLGESEQQIKEGKIYTHEEVMTKTHERYGSNNVSNNLE